MALIALIAAALLLRLRLVFLLNVNWDEFYFLHLVYSYLQGHLSLQLQTFHVHFFTWLPEVSRNEVDQIVAARVTMYGLLLGSTILTYVIARNFLDTGSSLFAVLCYLSLSYALEHGTSFRADPIASFLFLGSVTLLLRSDGRWLAPAFSGLAAAMAVMITIKSMFFLPVLGAMLLAAFARRDRWVEAAWRMAAFGCSFLASFAALYLAHRATLAAPAFDAAGRMVERSADKVIMFDRPFPQWGYLLRTLVNDTAVWMALVFGAVLLMARRFLGDRRPPQRQLFLLIFLLPLGTLVFYRNAFPYYYVFLLSPAVVLCGVTYQQIMAARPGRARSLSPILGAAFIAMVCVGLGKTYLANAENRTTAQRMTVQLVHRLFPHPVPYIDRTNMIASFPKVGFFMTTWGIESYHAKGKPIFRDLISRERPLFLIADHPAIDPRVDQSWLRSVGYSLFEADYRVIVDNYVHHWGDLYVAGKRLRFASGAAEADFDILIPGRYTLEAGKPIEIDGSRLAPGDTVVLPAGTHRASVPDGTAATAVLRWGDHLYRPSDPAPPGPLFAGF